MLELAGTATRKPGNSRLPWGGYAGMPRGGRREPRGQQRGWALPPTLVTEEECQKGRRRKRCSCFLSRRKASTTSPAAWRCILSSHPSIAFSTPRPSVWGWKLPSEMPYVSQSVGRQHGGGSRAGDCCFTLKVEGMPSARHHTLELQGKCFIFSALCAPRLAAGCFPPDAHDGSREKVSLQTPSTCATAHGHLQLLPGL